MGMLERRDMDEAEQPSWPGDIGPVFLSQEAIQRRVTELGAQISRDYAGKDLVAVGVLKGIVFFMTDLLRAITMPITVDFLDIARYGRTEQTRGVVRLTKDLTEPLSGRHVLFVEDVIDTGLTSHFILGTLRHHEPASLSVCVLLDRPSRRIIDIDLAYVGFEVSDTYIVGYGLDYRERYRNLPYIVQFKRPQ
jgi:hypoxanthine phosphoribosyltransferase